MVRAATEKLRVSGSPTPKLDAEVILSHVLPYSPSREWLIMNDHLSVDSELEQTFNALLERRSELEPVSYLTKRREFWSLDFEVSEDTLIPRPDSEILIDCLLRDLEEEPVRILDIGTGTGCLLISALHELKLSVGVGIDISPGALSVAQRNGEALGVSDRAMFAEGDLHRLHESCAHLGPFDVVLCNPPYLVRAHASRLPATVSRFEPALALFGGDGDGMGAYRSVAEQLTVYGQQLLSPTARVYVEVGEGQAEAVSGMLTASHTCGERLFAATLAFQGVDRDLAGNDRVLSFCRRLPPDAHSALPA